MGNLRREAKKILLTTADINDELVTAITGGVFIANYNQMLVQDVCYCVKHCYEAGTPKIDVIQIRPKCPCDECETIDVGITVIKPNRTTGDFRDHNVFQKYYGHYLPVLKDCSNGYLHEDDVEEITANIVEMILNDPYAIVEGDMAVRFDWTAGIPVIIVRNLQGQILETITAAGASVAQLVTAVNASTYLTVYASDTDYITVQCNDHHGYLFDVTNLAKDQLYYAIGLTAKDVNVQFISQVDGDVGIINEFQAGVFPSLSYKDIARIFPVKPSDAGTLKPGVVIGGEYCSYMFRLCHDRAYNHSFANHIDKYDEEVIFYGLKSELEGAYFEDKLMDAGLLIDCLGFESESASASASPSISLQ